MHTPGKRAVDQLRTAVDHAYPRLLLQPEKRLDDKEGATVGLRQLFQDRRVRLRGEHVRCQLHDRVVVERAEHDRLRPFALQLIERVHEGRRLARRAQGDHPCDRQSHQSHRQRSNRGNRSTVRPVGVVDGDHERRVERGAFQQLLQVPQQPEPLFGLRVKRREPTGVEQRVGSLEQRREQGCELDHRLTWVGSAAADPDVQAASDRRDFGEQPALAHARGALDDDHRLGAIGKSFKLASDQRQLGVAPMELTRWHCRHDSLAPSIHPPERRLSNHRFVRCANAPYRTTLALPQLGRRDGDT